MPLRSRTIRRLLPRRRRTSRSCGPGSLPSPLWTDSGRPVGPASVLVPEPSSKPRETVSGPYGVRPHLEGQDDGTPWTAGLPDDGIERSDAGPCHDAVAPDGDVVVRTPVQPDGQPGLRRRRGVDPRADPAVMMLLAATDERGFRLVERGLATVQHEPARARSASELIASGGRRRPTQMGPSTGASKSSRPWTCMPSAGPGAVAISKRRLARDRPTVLATAPARGRSRAQECGSRVRFPWAARRGRPSTTTRRWPRRGRRGRCSGSASRCCGG